MAQQPYNILLLMSDQHRADHVGYSRSGVVETPAIDRIAEGCSFSNCVSVNPICTPARTSLLTGKYSHQIGMLSMSGDLSLKHPTYLRALRQAGYWTAAVGKLHWLQGWPWQIGRGRGHDLVGLKNRIKEYGLDHVWEAAGKQLAVNNYCDYCAHLDRKGLLEDYCNHIVSRGPNSMGPAKTRWSGEPWPFDEDDYVDVVTGREIIQAIEDRPIDKPFFIFGSFCSPHKPYDPPASYLEKAAPDDPDEDFIPGKTAMEPEVRQRLRAVRRAYRAMVNVVDDQVALVFDTLERKGLLDSTVVLFISDHGEMLGDHNRMSKMQPWRQSVTVPAAVRHPDHLSARRIDAPIESIDFTATMLDIAGIDTRSGLTKSWPSFHDRVPCRSLMPVVTGQSDSVRDLAFSECRGAWRMVQTARWKYIRFAAEEPGGSPREALFDLTNDPQELHDRAGEPAAASVLRDLRERTFRIMEETPAAQTGWAPYGQTHNRDIDDKDTPKGHTDEH